MSRSKKSKSKRKRTKLDYRKPRLDGETMTAIIGCVLIAFIILALAVMLAMGVEL